MKQSLVACGPVQVGVEEPPVPVNVMVRSCQIVAAKSGQQVPARVPGDGKLEPLEDAPGSYVSSD